VLPSDVSHVEDEDAKREEASLVQALRERDEAAFALLLNRHHRSLLALALLYVPSRAIAEEVVQETWLGVLRGIDRFEGRSSLKTWIYRILVNRAKTHGRKEGRTEPFSALQSALEEPGESSVDPSRFRPPDAPRWPNHWLTPPDRWGESAEDRLLSKETQALILRTIDGLPPNQRAVITLRDVDGLPSHEVCHLLSISSANERVLLHRARSKVRGVLEEYFQEA
jgi:RNA polymerase sigma-70 factor, ECF subfamily